MATSPTAPTVVRFSVFEVDLRTGELWKHGVRIKLQEQPFKIIAMLLEHPGELVTREQIKEKLWRTDTYVDFEHSMNTAVRRLREVLGDDAETPRFIETLPRRGYRFLAPVVKGRSGVGLEALDEKVNPASPVAVAADCQHQGRRRSMFHSRWFAVAVFVTVVAVAVLSGWRFWPHRAAIDAVAVLPFANETNDSSLDYFADGITEGVMDNLSEIEQLRVMSRNSAFAYRKQPIDNRRAGAELHVPALLLGVLRRNGDKLEIGLELIDAQTDRHLWGSRYNVDAAQIVAVQLNITEEVARALRQRITAEARRRMVQRKATNAIAYDAFLHGLYLFSNRSNANFQSALQFFQAAIDADPNFALAYAGMAGAYGLLGFYGGMEPAEALRRQEIAVDRALELDPDLALARMDRGINLAYYHRDLGAAEREILRAIALDPNSAMAHQALADVLQPMGRLDEAIAESRRAAELDPLSHGHVTRQAIIAYEARRYEQAIELLRRAPRPPHGWLGVVYATAGRNAEALAELDQVPSTESPRTRCLVARGYALAERPQYARVVLVDALRRQKEQGSATTRYCSPFEIAAVYAAMGERAPTLQWLNTAVRAFDFDMMQNIRTDPVFDRYRSDPEFLALVALVSRPR